MNPETVSLCMIVKNEAANLADCLTSVADFADETIIVDTGSTDHTVEIAQSFGATVHHFVWCDDFAAARNESLRHATGDWIFWLDADDRLSAEGVARLKQTVASGQADAYRCRMVSPLDGEISAVNVAYYTLLFRNHCGVQFEGPIHESPTESIVRRGMTIANSTIVINHSGYADDPARLQQKARRNVRILRRCVAAEPQKLKWRYHLGVSLYQLADYRGAIEQFEPIVNGNGQTLDESHRYRVHLLLASAYTTLPAIEQAETVIEQILTLFPHRLHAWISAGMFYLRQQQPAQAIAMLRQAQALVAQPALEEEGEQWVAGALENQLAAAYHLLGMDMVGQKNYADAAAALQSAIETAGPSPENSERYKLLALCLQKLGHEDAALVAWRMAGEAE